MRTDALIEKLSEIHPKGFDLSLDRITGLLNKLGNPHLSIPPAFHVAGTNGKGSTLAFLRAILEAQGYKVHVHTSPHLVHWCERYRLGGTFVDDDTLADAIERVAEANGGKPITIFEIMSAVMFVLFSEHEADFSLVEVGLGGRFDATNVISDPIACAITPVALDHQAYLGDTIAKIAFEKAGIVKQSAPVAIAVQEDDARDVIEKVAATHAAPIRIARQDFDFHREGRGFVFQDEDGLLDLPLPKLIGEHQISNAALAIATIRASGVEVSNKSIEAAMDTVRWPGRMERLQQGKITKKFQAGTDIWIDGGHNPNAGNAIAEALREQRRAADRPLIMICGMINTKDPIGYFEAFKPLGAKVITVPVAMSEAGIPASELAETAKSAGLEAISSASLNEGIDSAIEAVADHENCQVLFCGSLYMVGEVLEKNDTPPK